LSKFFRIDVDPRGRRSSPCQGGPMKYLSFIRSPESFRNQAPPPAMIADMGEFVQTCFREGSVVDTGGLMPSKAGFRERVENGQLTVTDGPMSESMELIGGW